MTSLLLAAAAAAGTSLLLTPALRHLGIRRGYLDVPNERSSHDRPTPKTGGYAVLAGTVAGVGLGGAWVDGRVSVILGAALLAAGLALADDRRTLPRFTRLLLQVAIVGVLIWGLEQTRAAGQVAHTEVWVVRAVALVWVLALINTYNFMDGLNGMAGIAATVTGAALSLQALQNGDTAIATLAVAVTAAAAGFLPFNLRSGSIFLGDAGSTGLGLLFGALVVEAGASGAIPVAAALPLAPFLLDAGTTLVRRALRGERFFSTPHRSHYYQRLQQAGWSHAAVAGLYGMLTAACALGALVVDRLDPGQRAVLLAAVVLGHAAVFASIQRAWSRRTRAGDGR